MKEFVRIQNSVFAVNAIVHIAAYEKSIMVRTTHGDRTFWFNSEAKAQEAFESLWNYFAG